VLLTLAAVLVTGRLLGALLAKIRQPPVIGEVLAGIVLGPSLLGRFAPDVAAAILPPSIAPQLRVIAELSVILYMFIVGLDLRADLLRGRARGVVLTSNASILVPFALGLGLAVYLYPRLSPPEVPFTSFALFMGVAMSITAFPVLARIVNDRGLAETPLGTLALACAAVDDVTAWCLLALIVGIAQGRVESAVLVVAMTTFFAGLMLFVVRPLLARTLGGSASPARPVASSSRSPHVASASPSDVASAFRRKDQFAIVLAGLLLSALAAERIGIHAIFGAFLFGAILPRGGPLPHALKDRMHDLVTILLLPAFFAFTGMRTEIGLVTGVNAWMVCGLIILVATLGKFGGTFAGARLNGMDARTSAKLGILMNTRGLMELIVLNVGRDLNVISPALFTMMVLMALVTTIATTPILDALGGARKGDTHTSSQLRTHPREL
jgi:Kef-type K+ transport system membrane component KefB